jgi:hypothetical protein
VTDRGGQAGVSPRPWHPLGLAAVIVIGFWLSAAVSPYAAFRSLALALLLAAALTAVAAAASRSWMTGGVIASCLIGLLWIKGLLVEASRIADRMGVLAIVWVLLLAVAIGVGIRLALRAQTRVTLAGLTVVLNRVAALLLAATLVLGMANGAWAAAARDLQQGIDLDSWQAMATEGTRPSASPDIYAILLDGYPRADTLEYAFDFDNAPFVEALEARGFDVAEESHSDYLWTHVSVPSALNMRYVEQIPSMLDVQEGRAPRQPTLRWTVSDNPVFETAREHGYTPISVGAGFEEVAPRQADVYVDGGQLNEFEISLLSSTFLADVLAVVAPDFASSQLRDRILDNLSTLPEIAAGAAAAPVLVFAHIPTPHQPTVFGEDGAPVAVPLSNAFFADSPQERGEDAGEFRGRYRAQLPYINQLVLDTVDQIIEASAEPPVIVLFADHGSASAVDWNATTPADADPARLLERTAILFAALTPGQDDLYPADISPVDLFRLVFDAYMDTEFGRAAQPADGGHIPPVDASVLAGPSSRVTFD